MEEPLDGRLGFVERHLDDGVHKEEAVSDVFGIQRARKVETERCIGGDDEVVCDCSCGEGNQEWIEKALTSHYFFFSSSFTSCMEAFDLMITLIDF